MPTYSYRCAACGHAFDQYQSFTDDTLTVCPSCNQADLRKVFNSIGVTFNGSGFYRTDSRSASTSSVSAGSNSSTSGASPSAPAAAPAAPAAASTPSAS
ncbi:FmdB family zinc ribbon protein [Salinibacterium hongtaonis]|uniref:FmdB family zinc ribbon protein n=1 Tax=Homoserinimonas hongtaonis TaxID=2079791 RepID=UPI000D3B9676|nr:FmdB family zinc ribbon protein [Salinibacterium hongtaonis]AWB89871.1 FmdB family transcriptional regulator [Salinibacterium hongtaonis]